LKLKQHPQQPVTSTYFTPWVRLWRLLYRQLCSMELAIVLLVVLGLACVMGSLLPQDNVVALDRIQFQFGDFYPYAKAMGWFTLFSSPWFLALEGLFFASVSLGSFHWLKPAYKQISQCVFLAKPNIEAFTRRRLNIALANPSGLSEAVLDLNQQLGFRFHIRQESASCWLLSAQKGWLGRVGPMVVHSGIVLLLAACLFGAFTDFLGQHVASPTEKFFLSEASVLNTSTPRPWWFGNVPHWQVRIDDFKMTFYPKAPTKVEQYETKLSILDPETGKILTHGALSVNHPLHYDGVSFYQASYQQTAGHFVNIGTSATEKLMAVETLVGRPYVKKTMSPHLALWFFPLSRLTDSVQRNQLQVFAQVDGVLKGFGKKIEIAKKESVTLVEGDAPVQFQGVSLQYVKPEIATGVQFKGATEVVAVYGAFILLTLGFLMSQIPHWQVWGVLETNKQNQLHLSLAWRAKKQLPALEKKLKDAFNALERENKQ
jgi:cytochrome c biogenesis protein